MNISKDLYEYLLDFVDYKTMINMFSVNKKINETRVFQRLFNIKYPLLIKFKKDNETWRYFYLYICKYISKLYEEFGIPYIPTKDYNPIKFYNNINKKNFYKNKNNNYIYNKAMKEASKGDHIEIVNLMIEKGANDFNSAMVYASAEGNMEIVKLMIEKGVNTFNSSMKYSSQGGHMEIVKLMIENGGNNFNSAMVYAGKGGHLEIVKFMIENGANKFNWTIVWASKGGYIEIIKLMIENGANNFDSVVKAFDKDLIFTTRREQLEIVKLFHNLKNNEIFF